MKKRAAARKPRPASRRVPARGKKSPAPRHYVTPAELAHLQESLREAQETLEAIRSGEVDAVVVSGSNGNQVYSLAGADQPYRVYVERMQEGAVTLSADGLILYCNHRFAEMLGRPLEKVIGSSLSAYLPPEAWRQLKGVFANGREVAKYTTVLLAGAALPVNLTASRLTLDGPPMLCLVVTDLSAQKEKEDMRLAKEVAEKANLAKDDFLAALSHELRTPLTPALMAATVLERDQTLSPTARTDAALIRRNVELEARLIDDLLDLTLITHGKLSLQTGETQVHDSLRRALEIVAADAKAKDIDLRVHLDAHRGTVNGDPVRIQQVCWNVLRNAVKFTPSHGTVTVTTGNDADNHVWIRVTDTGIGFAPDKPARIFEAFEQGGRHITRQFGGLGLGLAISRSIMLAHGGRIEAQSRGLNHGASFTMNFPLTRAAPRKASAAPKPEPARTPGLAILLVEDHKDTRVCLQRLLEASGHRVIAAANAATALGLATHHTFELVISDVGLPDLGGHELMRRLRASHGLPGIALSGYGMEQDLAKSRAAGFRYHLTKPVSFEQLKSFVAEFAAQRETAPAVSPA